MEHSFKLLDKKYLIETNIRDPASEHKYCYCGVTGLDHTLKAYDKEDIAIHLNKNFLLDSGIEAVLDGDYVVFKKQKKIYINKEQRLLDLIIEMQNITNKLYKYEIEFNDIVHSHKVIQWAKVKCELSYLSKLIQGIF